MKNKKTLSRQRQLRVDMWLVLWRYRRMLPNKDGTLTKHEEQAEPEVVYLKGMGESIMAEEKWVKFVKWWLHLVSLTTNISSADAAAATSEHSKELITSHQFVEVTSSLACAETCTFGIVGCNFRFVSVLFIPSAHLIPVSHVSSFFRPDRFLLLPSSQDASWKGMKVENGRFDSREHDCKRIRGVRMDLLREAHTFRHCALLSSRQRANHVSENRRAAQQSMHQFWSACKQPHFNDAWDHLKQSRHDWKQRVVRLLYLFLEWKRHGTPTSWKIMQSWWHLVTFLSLKSTTSAFVASRSDASNFNMSNTRWHHAIMVLIKSFRTKLRNAVSKRLATMPLPSMDLLKSTSIHEMSFSQVCIGCDLCCRRLWSVKQ